MLWIKRLYLDNEIYEGRASHVLDRIEMPDPHLNN